VQFNLADAQRIADVVGEVEGSRRGRNGSTLPRGVFALSHYLSKTTATWTKGTSQTLTVYVGDGGSETASSGETVEAWNYVGTLPSGVWVVLARANALFYLASFDFTGLPSYSATKQQVLGHSANGGLAWIDTTACT
jgi:hypothetical protein